MNRRKKVSIWLKGRTSNLFFGAFCIAYSLFEASGDREFYSVRGFPVSRHTWILWFVSGVGILFLGVIKKSQTEGSESHTQICTECYKIYKPSDILENVCPDCNGLIDNVKNFYHNNPDFMKQTKHTGGK